MPELWRSLWIELQGDEECPAAGLRVLQRVSPVISTLHLRQAQPRIKPVSRRAGQQQAVAAQQAAAAAEGPTEAAAVAACLPDMPALDCLVVHMEELPAVLAEALPACTALTHLDLHAGSLPQCMPAVMARMTHLRSLRLKDVQPSAALLAALPRLLQLSSLDFDVGQSDAAAESAALLDAVLPQLAQLRSLFLELRHVSPQLLGGIMQLRQLASLILFSSTPLPDLSALPTHLPLLEHLSLCERRNMLRAGSAVPPGQRTWPAPSAFPALLSSSLAPFEIQVSDGVGPPAVSCKAARRGASAMRLLASQPTLHAHSCGRTAHAPTAQGAGAGSLTECCFDEGDAEVEEWNLQLQGLSDLATPGRLLSAIIPPASPPIEALALTRCAATVPQALLSAGHWAQLHRVSLTDCGGVELQGLTLGRLRELTAWRAFGDTSCSLTIKHATLPALASIRTDGSSALCLCSTELPALTCIRMDPVSRYSRSSASGALRLTDVDLPALTALTVPASVSITLERVHLPVLPALERQRLSI